MSTDTTIREAVAGDIPAMMDLARQSRTASHWREADYARIFENASPARAALVLEQSGHVLGFVVAAHVGPEWEIENIVVAQEAAQRGIGSRLMEELLERARQESAESVFLEVRESNEAARALYRKFGFVETGRRKGYYSDPAEDGVRYRKSL